MKEKAEKPVKAPEEKKNKALTIIGIVLCAILIPILILNCVLIVKSFVKKDEVPSLFGITPMIVLTDSMQPEIKSGDLIVVKSIDAKDVKVGDDISFFDPAGNGSSVVTHRVVERNVDENGKISWKTKGINNNTEDKKPVPEDNLVGIYKGFRIPGAGNVAIFMQKPIGLILCVLVPLLLLVGYDLLRRRVTDKKKEADVAALQAELEALRKMQNAEGRMQNEATEAPKAEETNATPTEAPKEEVKEEVKEEPKEESESKNDEQSD